MPLNVKSFYSNNTVKCRFLQDAIEELEQEDVDARYFVLTGPSNAGNVTDEEVNIPLQWFTWGNFRRERSSYEISGTKQ